MASDPVGPRSHNRARPKPLTASQRYATYGEGTRWDYSAGKWKPGYRPDLTRIHVPQLEGIRKTNNRILVNAKIAERFLGLWAAWEQAGLLDCVLTYAGCYNARKVRGGRRVSDHAFAIAFDINVAWNRLGHAPALWGDRGSVLQLVPIAIDHGFYWGGDFAKRPDGMHFGVAV